MGYYYFQCRSITYAQRASKFLRNHSIYVGIVKMPLNISPDGCGYSLKVSERYRVKAVNLLNTNNFEFKRVFFSADEKEYREVQL